MLRQCFWKAGCQYGHTWLPTYLFLSFNSDSINTVCLSWDIKVFPKISQFGRESAFFVVIFGKLLRACFNVPGPAKLKIVRVRSVLDDVSVPFASCPPNRRHSEYYSCQTDIQNLSTRSNSLYLKISSCSYQISPFRSSNNGKHRF